MTGQDLQYYLEDCGLFKTLPAYFVEEVDGEILGRFHAHYQAWFQFGSIKVEVFYHTNKEKYVDFTYMGKNLYASHKLKDLDLPLLCKELSKFINTPEWISWSQTEIRNYKIDKVHE